ncbi:ubiquitin-like FUBI-ribosomal protein eS30 fusion protein [Sycon ciliatum]|uniref:ubiquitin-like FUBI-ribosomal protein eS30 fusion protein n=1 Tax=Sycon ciliatum TaxID=27933 RepID=UPI0020AC2629|eukprot:scpid35561/ scgid23042/ 40S ribosomal protein S30 &gt; 40S ribosomal protein S30 &gt; 40S ribosomal protein S30 &gt; 40S ribosomal protein S30 &gt; 40S ribosomal protein S30 &gt; 40S ribosomal protein S30 &gt; 40S ribosomal protein S30 &gt; 40S ribosomal protein S30
MQIFVRAEGLHAIEVDGTSTVLEVKNRIEELEGLEASEQVVLAEGCPLEDAFLVVDHVEQESTLTVTGRVVGGKVHGSLARAGKVKGQTPKVEAGEKKKRKTGRAKRRLQYNRRFVNVVASFGKRRGPNSNAQ